MRNIPIPVDTDRLTFVVVAAPRPRLVNQETGEVKVPKIAELALKLIVRDAKEKRGR